MAKKKDLSGSIKKVMFVYLVLLVGLISYIAYFQLCCYGCSERGHKRRNKR